MAKRWTLLGLLVSALVAVSLYQWILIEVTLHHGLGQRPFTPRDALAEYAAVLQLEIPVDANDAQIGPADAPAKIVVFSDFQCPACRRFSERIPNLLNTFEGQLCIVFKHHPLGVECNESITRDLHPRACAASWAAEAARRQNKFWTYHDALFATNLGDTKNTFQSIAVEARLDLDTFENELTDNDVKSKIAADIKLGMRLGIDATPSVFLNGRRLYDTRFRTLQFLIGHEVQNATK